MHHHDPSHHSRAYYSKVSGTSVTSTIRQLLGYISHWPGLLLALPPLVTEQMRPAYTVGTALTAVVLTSITVRKKVPVTVLLHRATASSPSAFRLLRIVDTLQVTRLQ